MRFNMTLDIKDSLTPQEMEQVKTFVEFLISRRSRSTAPTAKTEPERKISFEGWAGCLAHVHPELSDREFKQLIEDERVRQAME